MGIPIAFSLLLGFVGYLLNLLVMSELAWHLAAFFLGFAGGFLISFLISVCWHLAAFFLGFAGGFLIVFLVVVLVTG